ncbi:MAG TPA: 2-oxo-4-hydroxy-4-carboxy-5-ureidoimidazoline decarboxylase [Polyangiaceae bacterium]|nr:2-oxo-4-hydroxy-4-carboxy-5-ureidoimidazoline decarboxylase [Polyangiaceae bacterium]
MAEPHALREPQAVQEPQATPEPHSVLNALDATAAAEALRRACGAQSWVQRMLARRPFSSTEALYASADAEWRASTRDDYLEAFGHHPRIGEDLSALRQRFASAGHPSTANLSEREQAGVAGADEATLLALRDANAAYFRRFGFIFIICATGKTAAEMLAALRARLPNDPDTELSIAAAEHAQITRLRLGGLSTREPQTKRTPSAPREEKAP